MHAILEQIVLNGTIENFCLNTQATRDGLITYSLEVSGTLPEQIFSIDDDACIEEIADEDDEGLKFLNDCNT